MIGLLKPTSGRLTLGPFDLVEDPDAARQLCSYLPQAQMPIDSFKVREAITLTGMIRGGDTATVRRRADELIDALDIGEWRETLGARLFWWGQAARRVLDGHGLARSRGDPR